jgi:TrmH family RNA methyltransferase
MNIRLKHYKKNSDHSYTFGVFPTLEMLECRPNDVLGIVAHPKGSKNRGIVKIQKISSEIRIPFEYQEKVFNRLGARENDYAIGVFKKTETGLDQSANHVILVNPGSMGNLGTIIRTMLGFGFQDLAIIEPAADIFHPEVIRASMGSIFKIRFSRFMDFEEYRKFHSHHLYPLMTDGMIPLPEVSFAPPFGVIFGPENAGLPEEFHGYGSSVNIPQSDAIDSLNLATSVAVALYQANQRIATNQ